MADYPVQIRISADGTAEAIGDLGKLENAVDDVKESSEETSKASKTLSDKFKDTTASAKALGTAVKAIALGATATAMYRTAKSSLEFADSLGKTADKIGITTTQLQELQYIGSDVAGLTREGMATAMQRFSRRVGEAAQGTGELKDVLAEYSIAIKDGEGNMRDINAILDDYADAVKNADSEQEQLRLTFKAMDTEGVAFVNVMRQGSDAMDDMRKRARELGVVMDEELIRKAEELNSKWDTMTTRMAVSFKSMVITVIDSAQSMFQYLTEQTSGWSSTIETWEEADEKAQNLTATINDLEESLAEWEQRAEKDPSPLNVEQVEYYTTKLKEANEALSETYGTQEQIQRQQDEHIEGTLAWAEAQDRAKAALGSTNETLKESTNAVKENTTAAEAQAKANEKVIKATQKQAETWKRYMDQIAVTKTELIEGAEAARQLELAQEGLTEAQIESIIQGEREIEMLRAKKEELIEVGEALHDYMMQAALSFGQGPQAEESPLLDNIGELLGSALASGLLAAVKGGAGDEIGKLIGGNIGSTLGKMAGDKLGPAIGESAGDLLGSTAGSVLGSMVPGIGTALGSAAGSVLGELLGGLFGGGVTTPSGFATGSGQGKATSASVFISLENFARDIRNTIADMNAQLAEYNAELIDNVNYVVGRIGEVYAAQAAGGQIYAGSQEDVLAAIAQELERLVQQRLTTLFSSQLQSGDVTSFVRAGEYGDIAQTWERLTEEFFAASSVAETINVQMAEFSAGGAEAAQTLINVSGGLEQLKANSEAYYDAYFTEAEKQSMAIQRAQEVLAGMNETLGLVGSSAIQTKEQLRAYIEAQDANTEAGAWAIAQALKGAESLAFLEDLLADLEEEAAALEESIRELDEAMAEAVVNVELAIVSLRQSIQDQLDAIIGENPTAEDYLKRAQRTREVYETRGGDLSIEGRIDLIDQYIDQLMKALEAQVQAAREAADKEIEIAREQAEKELELASEWYDEARDQLQEELEAAREAVQDWYDDARDQLRDAFDASKEQLKDWFDDASEALRDAFDAAKESLSDWYDSASEALKDALDHQKDMVKDWFDQAKESVEDARDAAIKALKKVFEAERDRLDAEKEAAIAIADMWRDTQLQMLEDQKEALAEREKALRKHYDELMTAQKEAVSELFNLYGQFQSVIEAADQALRDMALSSANPAPATARLGILDRLIAELKERIENASAGELPALQQQLLDLLNQRLKLLQEVYQRPSPEYMEEYRKIQQEIIDLKLSAQDELDRVIASLAELGATIVKGLDGQTKVIDEGLHELEVKLELELQKIREQERELDASAKAIREEYNKRIEAINERFEARYDQLAESQEARLDALNDKFDAQIEALQNQYEARIKALEEKYEADQKSLRALYEARLEALENKYEADQETLREQYDARLEALEEKYEADLEVLENEFERRIDSIEDQFEARFKSLEEQYEARVKAIQDQLEKQIESIEDSYKATIKALRDAMDRDIQVALRERERLQRELLEKEIAEMEQDKQDLLNKLEQVRAAISQIKGGDASSAIYAVNSDAANRDRETWRLLGQVVGHTSATAVYQEQTRDIIASRGFQSGLAEVPFDNFLARLHKGERVLTAEEAAEYNNRGNPVTVNLTVNGGGSSTGLERKLREMMPWIKRELAHA